MSRRVLFYGISIAFALLLLPLVPGPAPETFSLTGHASAQIPDPENLTVPGAPSHRDTLAVTVLPEKDVFYQEIPEQGSAFYRLIGTDHRVEGLGMVGGAAQVTCRAEANTTDYQNWGFTQPGTRSLTSKGDTFAMTLIVSTSPRPSPEIFVLDIQCTMGGQVVTEFQIGTRVEPYMRMQLLGHPDYPPPTVRPDGDFTHKVVIENRGNRDALFRGVVTGPEDWTINYPETVFVNQGERKEVTITGVAPNDQMYYRYQGALFDVRYWPDEQEMRGQSWVIPATVHGFYLHPALVPMILLGLLAIAVFMFLIVYARRTVEEQVLGKPIPPWRIPVEREYLKKLEQEDPDEFYIMRYHLMVEEHQSALLWYKHFKHATRKDRKLERKWLRKTEKVKKRTNQLRSSQERLENRMARRLRVVPARRRRRLAGLEDRVLAHAWKEQRKLLKVHAKGVKLIDKLHQARVKREEKTILAQHQKEVKRIEKENRKRIKQGDDPLPLPEEPDIKMAEPEFPEPVEVPLMGVGESVFALRSERLSRRYNKKIAKRSKKAKNRMRKQGAKKDKKADRLKQKIPVAPSTHMYDEDEFVPEDEVVVEDDRPYLQRLMNVPSLEDRDALRRRRMVYRVRIKQAAREDNKDEVQRLKQRWQEERRRFRGRKEDKPESTEAAGGEGDAPPHEAAQGGIRSEMKEKAGNEGRGLALLTRRRRKETGDGQSDPKKEEADPASKQGAKQDDGSQS